MKSLPGALLPLALLCSCAASSFDPELSSSESALTGEAWVSGGGWIQGLGGPGTKATFDFVAGPGGQPTRGHLTLKDDSTGQTVQGTVITSFTECLSGQSQFDGTDTNNHPFAVQAADNGDPGAGRDNFSISGSDQNGVSYSNSGLLGGGNIQDHGFRCH